MIERLFVKELLGFKSIDIEFGDGLIVITGPSGAGKSVLINSLLANFGLANQEAKLCEVELQKPKELSSELYELEDEVVVKALKKDRVRYFLDGQNISKKSLKELFSDYVSYISVRDKSGFESETLILIVDNFITKKEKSFAKLLQEYKSRYALYVQKSTQIAEIERRVKESSQRVEFLQFEIDKISKIDPKEGEYEELLVVKKQLSKIDKINEVANRAEEIFSFEDSVYELFEMLEKDASYFSDAMNHLRSDFDDISTLSSDLADIDIEELLGRLEQLSSLIKRFGSIEEALKYLQECKEELASFETIEEDVTALTAEIKALSSELEQQSNTISGKRKKAAKAIEEELAKYLKELKLPAAKLHFRDTALYELGRDELSITLGETKVESLSGGEFNRVRLALMTVSAGGVDSSGVIVLDEIDANVSGDESIAIANMISNLAKSYQIFAISHQPHLSSRAKQHIMVSKDKSGSYVRALEGEERVKEIARIVGGESFNKEALEFAKGLF